MNQVSLRASPGGSTAFSCHWSRRCVFVKQPSFSAWPAAGSRKTSVAISSVRSSPRSTSGESYQKDGGLHFDHVADDQPFELGQRLALEPRVRARRRRDSVPSRRGPRPCRPSCRASSPDASDRRSSRGSQSKPKSFSLRRGVAVVRLQQADDVLVEVRPPARSPSRYRLTYAASVGRIRLELRHRRDSRAGCRRASGCRSSPGSRRGRAAPGCRRRAVRCCRAAAAGSPPTRMICTPVECCVQPTA